MKKSINAKNSLVRKIAEKNEDNLFSFDVDDLEQAELPELELKKYLALMRALQVYYQHSHWISKGDPYYGDHLLFERLYNGIGEEIDSIAEKMVGLGGDHFVCAKTIMSFVSTILNHLPEMNKDTLGYELAESALKMEKLFLSYTKKLYTKMKEEKSLTLGFDDMLMALYNSHEGNVYLLQQRVKK
jgi:starvation-inducible DNA-binding protein